MSLLSPFKEYDITTRQLAAHLSGIPHYQEEDYINLVHYDSVIDALDKFKNRPLLHKPGERYHYSSFGYNLLAAVIEGAAGISYLDYMHDYIFLPLGMLDTKPDYAHMQHGDCTEFYDLDCNHKLVAAPFTDNSDVWAAGGFLSTPNDLLKFASALIGGILLTKETLKLLFSANRLSNSELSSYGLGWVISEISGFKTISHCGGHFGASSSLVIIPELSLFVAMTSNLYSEAFTRIAYEIAEQCLIRVCK